MAVNIRRHLEQLLTELNCNNDKAREKVSQFLLDNDWFGISVDLGNLSVSDNDAEFITLRVRNYLLKPAGGRAVSSILEQRFPTTHEYFIKYSEENKLDKSSLFYLQDFLAYYLKRDLFLYSDSQLETLLEKATEALIKTHGDEIIRFTNWLLSKRITKYRKSYEMVSRYTLDDKNGAYELDDYLQLMYYLFNETYIQENKMWQQAAHSKDFADTWLYLALHYICALRQTDLEQLGHPQLTRPSVEVLEAIKIGKWSSVEARKTLLSITTRLAYLNITPNKTKNRSNVSQIKFIVPESCEVLIGTLLAICEAHYQLSKKEGKNLPLIRKINTYEQITRYMGVEIGNLFLERDFSSRSANKSYLQAVAMLADDVLKEKSELNIKGYLLAALARSHKGSFDEFAQTTSNYLKDAQLGQMKPEMVAKELFERGVLSMIPSMLLTIVTRGKYKELSPSQQTQMIKGLDLTPAEVEKTLELSIRADSKAQKALQTVVKDNLNANQLLTVCHRIGNDEAFSKQTESLCLLSAIGRICPFDERQHCVGCDFELQTKSTLLLLIGEFNRLNKQYLEVQNDLEKGKIKAILESQLKPCLTEMLQAISEQYGEDVLNDYEEIIKELIA